MKTAYSTIRCLEGETLSFYANFSELTAFDASINPDLQLLSLYGSSDLKKIEFPKDTSRLKSLNVGFTQVPPSDYASLTALTSLILRGQDGVSSLDVSKLSNLYYLDVRFTSLASLDLSQNEHIQGLGISGTTIPVASLDLFRYSALSWFAGANLGLTSLVGTPVTNLTYLDVSSNPFPTINLSGASNLRVFSCSGCGLNSINLTANPLITDLNLDFNELYSLNVTGLGNLETLSATNNNLTNINLFGNPALRELNLKSNNMTSMDLSSSGALTHLDLSDNHLAELDVTSAYALRSLLVADNELSYDGSMTKWDLHSLASLSELNIRNNPNLVLDFDEGVTFHADFLSSSMSMIFVEQARWASFTGADKPAWQYFDTDPYGFYSAP